MQYVFYGVVVSIVAVSLFLIWIGSLISWQLAVFFGIFSICMFAQQVKEALEIAADIRYSKRRVQEEKAERERNRERNRSKT